MEEEVFSLVVAEVPLEVILAAHGAAEVPEVEVLKVVSNT